MVARSSKGRKRTEASEEEEGGVTREKEGGGGGEEVEENVQADGAVRKGRPEDAQNIGIAEANGVEFHLTWNFKNINNAQTKAEIADVIERKGLLCPMLCSPEELGD